MRRYTITLGDIGETEETEEIELEPIEVPNPVKEPAAPSPEKVPA